MFDATKFLTCASLLFCGGVILAQAAPPDGPDSEEEEIPFVDYGDTSSPTQPLPGNVDPAARAPKPAAGTGIVPAGRIESRPPASAGLAGTVRPSPARPGRRGEVPEVDEVTPSRGEPARPPLRQPAEPRVLIEPVVPEPATPDRRPPVTPERPAPAPVEPSRAADDNDLPELKYGEDRRPTPPPAPPSPEPDDMYAWLQKNSQPKRGNATFNKAAKDASDAAERVNDRYKRLIQPLNPGY